MSDELESYYPRKGVKALALVSIIGAVAFLTWLIASAKEPTNVVLLVLFAAGFLLVAVILAVQVVDRRPQVTLGPRDVEFFGLGRTCLGRGGRYAYDAIESISEIKAVKDEVDPSPDGVLMSKRFDALVRRHGSRMFVVRTSDGRKFSIYDPRGTDLVTVRKAIVDRAPRANGSNHDPVGA